MQSFNFRHTFFPVGQGLFASGKLQSPGGSSFCWVFDCGTTSAHGLLLRAVDRLSQKPSTRAAVDLLMISHFDQDHISGITELIKRAHIRILLLPYLTLTERLLVAFADGMTPQDPGFRLFLDPVAFLTGIPGAQIDQIVFVPPTTGDGPPPADGGGEPPPEGEGPWQVNLDKLEPPPADAEFEKWKRTFPNIITMKPGSRLRVANAWEFVPYNDAALAERVTKTFKGTVERRRDRLLSADEKTRDEALSKLGDAYDDRFGSRSRERNLISLFVWGGPVTGWKCGAQHGGSSGLPPHLEARFFDRQKVGILYTGDAFLDTPKRLKELLRALGPQRIEQLCVLQVMHHGAEDNWHDGVAEKLNPIVSVFSSDPEHAGFGHPHALVLRDFWTRGPVQVDHTTEFSVIGRMVR
jgi:hypothetical protein